MARQTYFTSATKRPRSLRQILAELFSGRVMSRLDELETTVRLLNERLDNQASVVANVGAIVASGSSREAKSTRPLVKEKNNKDSSNGKFSKKEAETNGLRSHYSFTGDGSRSSRPEPFDAGGFAPIFPDICYHLTHYKPAAADIPVASDNPAHYADAIRYNARTPLQGSLLPLTRLVWA